MFEGLTPLLTEDVPPDVPDRRSPWAEWWASGLPMVPEINVGATPDVLIVLVRPCVGSAARAGHASPAPERAAPHRPGLKPR